MRIPRTDNASDGTGLPNVSAAYWEETPRRFNKLRFENLNLLEFSIALVLFWIPPQ